MAQSARPLNDEIGVQIPVDLPTGEVNMRGPIIVFLASLALVGCVQAQGFGPMPRPDESSLYRILRHDDARRHPNDYRSVQKRHTTPTR
jgi:hypothetical protein